MSKLSHKKCISPRYELYLFALSLLTAFTFNYSYAADTSTSTTAPSSIQLSGQVQHPESNADPVRNCMAAKSEQPQPLKKKKGPIKVVTHALSSEFGTESKNMLRDSILLFSAQDIDPYDLSAPKDKPYTLCEATMIDGSSASVIKYPDNSAKIVGGFADGTIIVPIGQNTWIVAYPNGVRGKLVKESSALYKIYRPDESVTTIKKTMSGDYDISNNQIGTMGTLRTDQLGMQYEFNSKTF
jgi:hypothetical protein